MSKKRTDLSARAIPKPNLQLSPNEKDGKPFDEEALRAIFCNPVYAGIPPFPPMVSDEDWVRTALVEIESEGAAQFLVNMLYVLRETMQAAQ